MACSPGAILTLSSPHWTHFRGTGYGEATTICSCLLFSRHLGREGDAWDLRQGTLLCCLLPPPQTHRHPPPHLGVRTRVIAGTVDVQFLSGPLRWRQGM